MLLRDDIEPLGLSRNVGLKHYASIVDGCKGRSPGAIVSSARMHAEGSPEIDATLILRLKTLTNIRQFTFNLLNEGLAVLDNN